MEDLLYRSEYLHQLFEAHVDRDLSVLEIGSGDDRNVNYLNERGWNVEGIDKERGEAIEDIEPKQYDVIYTMSCLFLIPPENNWVFEKIAKMARHYIITIEGETTSESAYNPEGGGVYGRDYAEVFKPFGFEQIAMQDNVFNQFGVSRVLKRTKTT